MNSTCLRPPHQAAFRFGPTVKPIGRSMLLRKSQLLPAPPLRRRRRSSLPQIRSSFNNQVFEDGAEGIVCYRDESTGEMICEGYDEGPRFRPSISLPPHSPRDTEIIDRLQLNWIQIVKGSEVYQGLATTPEEGFNCNGFNNNLR